MLKPTEEEAVHPTLPVVSQATSVPIANANGLTDSPLDEGQTILTVVQTQILANASFATVKAQGANN